MLIILFFFFILFKRNKQINLVYRLQGEPVNLREQQDAVEFFMSLVESLDEALKTLGHEQLMAKTMGGTYSDQKICKGCPHRYITPLLVTTVKILCFQKFK